MTAGPPRFETYDWSKGREWMLVRAADAPAQAILIPPLFEESHFLRGFITDFSVSLADRGVGTWIMDLPGSGESLFPLEDVRFEDWCEAVEAAARKASALSGKPVHPLAFRGGGLLLGRMSVPPKWLFAPEAGSALLRIMERSNLLRNGRNTEYNTDYIELSGYRINAELQDALSRASPPESGATIFQAAPSLWRRAEPGRDPDLARAAAQAAADWMSACGRR